MEELRKLWWVIQSENTTARPWRRSTHLNQRMPVGHRFPWICQHFTPVLSAQVVCVVADTTHADDLVMAHAVGAEEEEDATSTPAFPTWWCSCSPYFSFYFPFSKCAMKEEDLNFHNLFFICFQCWVKRDYLFNDFKRERASFDRSANLLLRCAHAVD